ncbi:MAG: DUF4037 domain-containing protein [Chloroflexi bacterium]|nr:MAG: DUF4037 domain-containing protein [Chloroflexota bacterium]
MPEFIPGMQLNEKYYWEAVRPILDSHFPRLAHSAGLLGSGSDVLGFDTHVSRDHQWGPRLVMFLPPEDFAATAKAVDQALRRHLPTTFYGYSTHFSDPDLEDGGTRVNQAIVQGPVNHLVDFYTVDSFWRRELGVSPFEEPDSADWLTFQEHPLLTLTTGKVFYDGLGLEAVRKRFAYYPHDVWLYLLASQWALISQEEAFVGRTSQVGDELGSRVIAARLVERIMRLCFLMEKRYAPYSKWFGTGFRQLNCFPRMGPLLENALKAADFSERDDWFSQAYTLAAELHNGLGITPPLETHTRTYSGWHSLRGGVENLDLDDPRNTRPFQVLFSGRFTDSIYAQIQDPILLSVLRAAGSVNQFLVESSDALQSVRFCRSLKDDILSSTEG